MSTGSGKGQPKAPAGDEAGAPAAPPEKPVCFVIMPIADQQNYPPGHFTEVYEDIIGPAIVDAGYEPVRADEVHASNLIHLDILSKLVDAPMAVCDLSAVNPNVMFELGIRQAFDKPVVLMKDFTTRDIFDIGPIRRIDYDSSLSFRGVSRTRKSLTDMITATAAMKDEEGTNSIVRLLGLRAAAVKSNDNNPESARYSLLEKAVTDLSSDTKRILQSMRRSQSGGVGSTQTKISSGSTHYEIEFDEDARVTLDPETWDSYQQVINNIRKSTLAEARKIFRDQTAVDQKILLKIMEPRTRKFFENYVT